jgi:hypothetical protein
MTHDTLRAAAEAAQRDAFDERHPINSEVPGVLREAFFELFRQGWEAALSQEPPAAAPAQGEREAFEAWAVAQPWLEDDEGRINLRYLGLHKQYVDMTVEHASRAFFAGRAIPHPPAEGSQTK